MVGADEIYNFLTLKMAIKFLSMIDKSLKTTTEYVVTIRQT